jgi:hypothetical protein
MAASIQDFRVFAADVVAGDVVGLDVVTGDVLKLPLPDVGLATAYEAEGDGDERVEI